MSGSWNYFSEMSEMSVRAPSNQKDVRQNWIFLTTDIPMETEGNLADCITTFRETPRTDLVARLFPLAFVFRQVPSSLRQFSSVDLNS